MFTSVYKHAYNIFVTGIGETISGRVTDKSGSPIGGATLMAEESGDLYTMTTKSKGIYALVNVTANTAYSVTVEKEGYSLQTKNVTTGRSIEKKSTSGNKRGD